MRGRDPEMWLAGNEDGDVLIYCRRRKCMKDGRKTSGNPEGVWLDPEPVGPYRPTPSDVLAAWNAHLARHREAG